MFLQSLNQSIPQPPRPSYPGKFIVLYGINNIGKSTQAKLLVEMIKAHGQAAEYVKYPVYDLVPSGVLLNNFLRQGNVHTLSAREAQIVYALNRTQFEPVIIEKLKAGITIVAEDYTGTGIAWGLGSGVPEDFLKFINSHLLKEDLAIFMDGERFTQAVETTHRHETNDSLTQTVRAHHLRLAREYGWRPVAANGSIEEVQRAIWTIAKPLLFSTAAGLEPGIAPARPDIANLSENRVTVTHINPTLNHVDIKQQTLRNPRLLSATERADTPASPIVPITTPLAAPVVEPGILTLSVRRLTREAKLPVRAHATDAGLDIFSDAACTLYPSERALLGTGVAFAIPAGYAGLIWDKSGLAARGLKTMGGVIDAGFRGEVKVVVYNAGTEAIVIERGQKIAQMLIQKIEAPDLVEVDALDSTERHEGSFGSTGQF